jgi:hypothetical protein
MFDNKNSNIGARSLTGLFVLLCLSGSAMAQGEASLIGHWTLDNGAADAVGAYNGQLIGIGEGNSDRPFAVPGKIGQALQFNGGTGVEVPVDLDYRTHPALTVTMWVRLGDKPRAAGTQTLISTGAGDGPRIELARDQVKAVAGGRVLGPKHALVPGEWNFIAVSWDHAAGSMSMTVNNTHAFYPVGYVAKRSQQTYISPRDPDLEKYGRKGAQKRYLWIGAKDGFGKRSSLTDVAVDDVRVYSGILLDDQLVELSGGVSNGTYIPAEGRGIVSTWAPELGDRVGAVGVMPDTGDGSDEVGALPVLFGDQPKPDISVTADDVAAQPGQPQYGNITVADPAVSSAEIVAVQPDSEQRVLMATSDPDLSASGTPTSVMPSGGSTASLSGTAVDDLQQAHSETAPLDITYASEEEGLAAAAAAEERRASEAAAAAAEEPLPKSYTTSYSDDVIAYSGISGIRGDFVEQVVFTEYQQLLRFVQTVEENNKPCKVVIDGVRPLHGATAQLWGDTQRATVDECGDGMGRIGFGAFKDLEEQSLYSYAVPVTRIQTCRPGFPNNRVKGFRVESRNIEYPSGSYGSDIKTVNFDQKSNCDDWNDWQSCPSNTYAIGLRMHFKDGSSLSPKDFLVGVELVCASVTWEELTAEP